MNTKFIVANTKFIAASVFAFVSASGVQAADVVASEQPEPTSSSVVVSPSFSWSGFYFGGQIGGRSGKTSATVPDVEIPLHPDEVSKGKKWIPLEEKYLPKLSGFTAGLYAGVNFDVGNGLVLGVDTDMLLFQQKDTKTETVGAPAQAAERRSMLREGSDDEQKNEVRGTVSHTLKQKWSGATRVRVGLPFDRVMPYVSGGVAYGQFQDIFSVSITGEQPFNATSDVTNTMIGYTLGGGIDFAVTDDIILRAEYRYSDFGKKKFKDVIEIKHNTNDFRAGVAYKF
ncbi:outer membrane protein [Bartonella rattaustraliani]|uniref:outer membrane protein n=1 Tax=Bartonella rattaustraliani TaxID=481139 RepID=UPI00037F5048|nr:outer membrane protein [Bartonella rattaustraliani]